MKAVTPSEFWQLTPNEIGMFLEEHEIEQKQASGNYVSDLQEAKIEQKRQELIKKGYKVA